MPLKKQTPEALRKSAERMLKDSKIQLTDTFNQHGFINNLPSSSEYEELKNHKGICFALSILWVKKLHNLPALKRFILDPNNAKKLIKYNQILNFFLMILNKKRVWKVQFQALNLLSKQYHA